MPDTPAPVDDAAFARAFFRRAVTRQRVESALESLARKELRFGPYSAAGLASVSVTGRLGSARVEVDDVHLPSFAVSVPAALDVAVRLGVESRLSADVEISLRLTPKPAAPLLLVIDIEPVRADDVRVEVHGAGLGAAIGGVLTGLADELRGQIARQLTSLLHGDSLTRSRTFDIAARIAGVPDADLPTRWEWIEDERFTRTFLRLAVTDARLREAFAGFAGQPVEIGPLEAGPGGRAAVTVTGEVGTPEVRGADAAFDITLPLSLDLVVDLARENRFHADVEVLLTARARAADDLHVVVDLAPVDPATMTVTLTAQDRRARLLGRAGKIEDQLRRHVARAVDARVASAPARVVDIGARIDAAVARRRPRPSPR